MVRGHGPKFTPEYVLWQSPYSWSIYSGLYFVSPIFFIKDVTNKNCIILMTNMLLKHANNTISILNHSEQMKMESLILSNLHHPYAVLASLLRLSKPSVWSTLGLLLRSRLTWSRFSLWILIFSFFWTSKYLSFHLHEHSSYRNRQRLGSGLSLPPL
jgi:hypothetical protein